MATDEQIFREAGRPVKADGTSEDFMRSLLIGDAELIKAFREEIDEMDLPMDSVTDSDRKTLQNFFAITTAMEVVKARASLVIKWIAEREKSSSMSDEDWQKAKNSNAMQAVINIMRDYPEVRARLGLNDGGAIAQ